jgi:hypothetical protein
MRVGMSAVQTEIESLTSLRQDGLALAERVVKNLMGISDVRL